MDILSERIKKRKNELKLTYEQIADQLFVTRVAVQNWGLGKALPNSDRIPDICRILQCTPNYLFGFSEMITDDLIFRRSAMDIATGIWTITNDKNVLRVLKDISNINSAPPEKMKAKWQEHKDYPGIAFLCSRCNCFTTKRSNYCPDCGSEMER